MSLVCKVGRRSTRTRVIFLSMYLLLIAGAISMVYPFMLMLSTSTCSIADKDEFKLVPEYWFNDGALFKKYMADAVPINVLAYWFGRDDWFTFWDIHPADFQKISSMPAAHRSAMAGDLREFISKACPARFKVPLFFDTTNQDSPLALQTEYFSWLEHRYGSLQSVNRVYQDTATKWEELGIVQEQALRPIDQSLRARDWREFLETRSPERTGIFNADLCAYFLLNSMDLSKVQSNLQHKIKPVTVTYGDISSGMLGQDIKRQFLTDAMCAKFIVLDTSKAKSAWQSFLQAERLPGGIPLSAAMPGTQRGAALWNRFVQGKCPTEAITLQRPEDYWRSFLGRRYANIEDLNKTYGSSYATFDQVRIPYVAFHYDQFVRNKSALRLKYMTHNFSTVLAYITVHGQSLIVTVVYIALALITALTVNPLAAYAMSRFRLKESYHVLVFLLATMAFPGEVLMIPSFLMTKNFPLAQVVVAGVCFLVFALLGRSTKKNSSLILRITAALVVTLFLAGWVAPRMAGMLHIGTSVSLLNTFWALILPGMANGYSIFLLKGFFDSLPPELYEAGLIDGASEMQMFWKITLPLCKPILAVMALGAFTVAYGAFMQAFLVCQDTRMWTLMVFLYQFQQTHGLPMVMSSLVIAALPTLLVFVFCQNIILRGIVIPTYK